MTAEEAVREAKGHGDMLRKRVVEDELPLTLDELEQIHAEADERILSEKQALTEDRDQLSSHMDRIGKHLFMFVQ